MLYAEVSPLVIYSVPLFLSYLHTELLVSQAARSQKQYRSEGRDRAEQAEEGGS